MRDRIYLRVSTVRQARRDTPIETQRERCTELSARTGGTITGEYVEPGRSGGLHPRKRPSLRRALEDARRGEYDRLLIYEARRLSRDLDLTGWLQVEFGEAGVEVLDWMRYGAPRIARQVDGLVGDAEREMMRERGRSAASRILRECRRQSSHDALGYRWESKTNRVPDPMTAPRVRAMFEASASGEPISLIARRHGMAPGNLRRLLRSPIYIGHYVHTYRGGLPRVSVPGAHTPLISEALWSQVQSRLDRQRDGARNGQWGSLPLTGILVCHCGRRMRVGTVRGGRRWYTCGDHPEIEITGWPAGILAATIEHLRAPDLARRIAEAMTRAARAGVDLGEARQQLAALEAARDRLVDAIASGAVSDTRALTERLQRTQEEIRTARALVSSARRSVRLVVDPALIEAQIEALLAGRLEPDRATLHRIVESATVGADGAVMVVPKVDTAARRDIHLQDLGFLWRPAA